MQGEISAHSSPDGEVKVISYSSLGCFIIRLLELSSVWSASSVKLSLTAHFSSVSTPRNEGKFLHLVSQRSDSFSDLFFKETRLI